jgi:hypothetical protein
MNATLASATAIGTSARIMYGRRRPKDACVASLIGPTSSGTKNAKTPSAASTSPISVLDSVNFPRTGGR